MIQIEEILKTDLLVCCRTNGVELFPPTVFDEQIYYGDVIDIKVTNPGKGYDVINGPDLIVQDQNGSGCKPLSNSNRIFL